MRGRTGPEGLVNRTDERARLAALLDTAEAGRAVSLALRGEPGIGKTTLLEFARADAAASGFTVLATQGRAIDAELAFAALLTLLRPVEGRLEALAGDLAEEVGGALALGRKQGDPVTVRLGVFRILAALAERGPVFVAVDDAHLLDAATADALAFALARLDADPVAVVLTADRHSLTAFDAVVDDVVSVGPLDRESLALLVRGEGAIADDVLGRCCALSGGNPLAALELARSLTPEERDGRAPLPAVPRPPAAVAMGFAAALADVSEAARRALAVAAADDTGDVDVIRAALERLGDAAEGLEEAEAAGLIAVDGSSLRFAHPLLRSVAYHQVAPRSRRAAHRALAAVLARPHEAAARAWQLAAAADGTDADAADALELVAGDVRRRGGPASAARTLERAASLSPEPRARGRRLVAAARQWLDAMDLPAAAAAITAADGLPLDEQTVIDALGVLAWTEGPRTAAKWVGERSELIIDVDPITLDVHVADLMMWAGDSADAVERVSNDGPAATPLGSALLRCAGRGASAVDLDEALGADARSRSRGLQALVEAGRADRVPTAAGPTGHVSEDMPTAIEVALWQAEALIQRGQPDAAYELLQKVRAVIPERAAVLSATVDVALSEAEFLLGRPDDARPRLESAREVLAAVDHVERVAHLDWVQGRLALAIGDGPGAASALERAARLRPHLYGSDLVLALRLTGAVREARACAERLEASDDPLPAARRARALAVASDDADGFRSARDIATDAGLPLEAAETALAEAEVLTERSDARAPEVTAEAAALLAPLAVHGWDPRLARISAGAEHQRSGRPGPAETPTAPASAIAALLSPAEYRVATAVASGRTNREAAAELYLSVKTVDFHLQNIYRKLGVRSRTELAVRASTSVTAAAGERDAGGK